jgi:DNA repair photolyase
MKRSLEILSPQSKIAVKNPISKQEFELLKESFASLSEDENNPLSCISVANSSLSLDLWKGCRWQCAYCHVQGATRNLNKDGYMPAKAELHKRFTEAEVVEALINTSIFKKDETLISIGTASTEPFAVGEVLDSTFSLINELIKHDLTNPVWIVTKAGIPNQAIPHIAQVTPRIKSLIISPAYGALSKEIEPIQNNRFVNIQKASSLGAKIILYLRPLVKAWGTTTEKVKTALESASKDINNKTVSAIVIGGLRWTEGIEYGLHNRSLVWPSDLEKKDNAKDLPDDLYEEIKVLCEDLMPNVPIVKHSSCALAHVLRQSDGLLTYANNEHDCKNSECNQRQREACMTSKLQLENTQMVLLEIKERLRSLNINIDVKSLTLKGGIISQPTFETLPFSARTTILKILGNILTNRYE